MIGHIFKSTFPEEQRLPDVIPHWRFLMCGRKLLTTEKDYDQPWTKTEMEEIAQRWCSELIDEITQRLEGFL